MENTTLKNLIANAAEHYERHADNLRKRAERATDGSSIQKEIREAYQFNRGRGKAMREVLEFIAEDKVDEMRERMLAYLQELMDRFKVEEADHSFADREVRKKLDEMIACKEMVEALLGEPVNLRLDGKVTIGF